MRVTSATDSIFVTAEEDDVGPGKLYPTQGAKERWQAVQREHTWEALGGHRRMLAQSGWQESELGPSLAEAYHEWWRSPDKDYSLSHVKGKGPREWRWVLSGDEEGFHVPGDHFSTHLTCNRALDQYNELKGLPRNPHVAGSDEDRREWTWEALGGHHKILQDAGWERGTLRGGSEHNTMDEIWHGIGAVAYRPNENRRPYMQLGSDEPLPRWCLSQNTRSGRSLTYHSSFSDLWRAFTGKKTSSVEDEDRRERAMDALTSFRQAAEGRGWSCENPGSDDAKRAGPDGRTWRVHRLHYTGAPDGAFMLAGEPPNWEDDMHYSYHPTFWDAHKRFLQETSTAK